MTCGRIIFFFFFFFFFFVFFGGGVKGGVAKGRSVHLIYRSIAAPNVKIVELLTQIRFAYMDHLDNNAFDRLSVSQKLWLVYQKV